MTRNPRTEAEVDLWFGRLESALQTTAIPDGVGNYRLGTADEFMLMDLSDESCGYTWARFKHRGSRNYIQLSYNLYSGTSHLSVPVADTAFFRGTFPAIGAEVTS